MNQIKVLASKLVSKKSSQMKSSSTSNKNLHKCHQCKKTFTQKGGLRKHETIHLGLKKFECKDCGNRFNRKDALKDHLRIHTEKRLYKCLQCNKTFKQSSGLRVHKIIHLGLKKFECNDCGKRFMRKDALKNHLRIHTGEKPYKCLQCNRTFKHSSGLRYHEQVHLGLKKFECNDCGKKFIRKGVLKIHLQIHTKERLFKCLPCNKTFTQLSNLRTHEKIHLGLKKFECNECGKRFSTKDPLKKHLQIHTSEGPYNMLNKKICCNKNFVMKKCFVPLTRCNLKVEKNETKIKDDAPIEEEIDIFDEKPDLSFLKNENFLSYYDSIAMECKNIENTSNAIVSLKDRVANNRVNKFAQNNCETGEPVNENSQIVFAVKIKNRVTETEEAVVVEEEIELVDEKPDLSFLKTENFNVFDEIICNNYQTISNVKIADNDFDTINFSIGNNENIDLVDEKPDLSFLKEEDSTF